MSGEKVNLFRPADYEELTGNHGARLQAVVDRARRVENARIEPTFDQRVAMTQTLLKFIRDKKRIVYGGYAIHKLIQRRNPKDGIYDLQVETPDVEFYSPDAVLDVKELCDAFHAQGQPYVRGTEAFHAETYKVTVNLVQLCDVTYAPKNVFRAIPFVVIDGIRYASAHFLLIDQLRVLTDPLTSYWRLEKTFPRLYLLQRYYPLEKPQQGHEQNLRGAFPPPNESIGRAMDAALEVLGKLESVESVIVGCAAWRSFAIWAGRGDPGVPSFLEVIVTSYVPAAEAIYGRLLEMFGKDALKYVEHQRFFDYCGRRGHFFVNGQLAVCLYHHNNRCTPVQPPVEEPPVQGGEPRIAVATLSVTAMYLMISGMLCRAASPPNYLGQAVCDSLLFELYAMRTEFMESNREAVVEGDHPFREFTAYCVGRSIGALRAHKEETEYRRKRLGLFGMAYFAYEPEKPAGKKFDAADYKYMNSSGNAVKNRNDQLFKPPGHQGQQNQENQVENSGESQDNSSGLDGVVKASSRSRSNVKSESNVKSKPRSRSKSNEKDDDKNENNEKKRSPGRRKKRGGRRSKSPAP
jgi:hypothetical protein